MRFDPALSREETLARLTDDAVATWGQERAAEMGAALESTAHAIWVVAQEPLDPTDVEPLGGAVSELYDLAAAEAAERIAAVALAIEELDALLRGDTTSGAS